MLTVPRSIGSSKALQNVSKRELRLAQLYIIATISFSFGCISFSNVIPYLSQHRWFFFIVAGAIFSTINVYDLVMLFNSFSSEPTERIGGKNVEGDMLVVEKSVTRRGIINPDTLSAFAICAGNVMLLNSGLLALHKDGEAGACEWQFVGAFSCYILGFAANTISHHEQTLDVIETRNTVVFQMSMASTLNLIGAIANVSGLGCTDNAELREVLRAWLHGVGGVIAFIASLVNYFHTIAFLSNEEILFAEVRFNAGVARREEEKTILANRSMLRKIWDAMYFGWNKISLLRKNKKEKYAHPDDVCGDDDVYVPMQSVSGGSSMLSTGTTAELLLSDEDMEGNSGSDETDSSASGDEQEEVQPSHRRGGRSSRPDTSLEQGFEQVDLSGESEKTEISERAERRGGASRQASWPGHTEFGDSDSEEHLLDTEARSRRDKKAKRPDHDDRWRRRRHRDYSRDQ